MFRKRFKNSSKPRSLRRKRAEDAADGADETNGKGGSEDDEYDDDTSAVQQAIRRTQKKQKILSALPLTSGGSGAGAGDGGRSKTASDSGTGRGIGDVSRQSTAELSILATKHKKNMEDFIEQQIAATTTENSAKSASTTAVGSQGGADGDDLDRSVEVTGPSAVHGEEDLYEQMARETYTGDQVSSQGGRQQDEDKGSGGAMLVGSGIAEVILPVHERLASLDRPGKKSMGVALRNKHIKSSSSAVPEGERNSLPSTTPTPVGRNMVTPLQRQQQEQNQRPHNFHEGNNGHRAAPGIGEDEKTHGRRGFADFLGKTTSSTADPSSSSSSSLHHQQQQQQQQQQGKGSSSSSFHRNQNRDDQVFSKFVTRHFQENRR